MKNKNHISIWVVEDNTLYRNNLVLLLNDQPDMNCEHGFSSCEETIAALETEKMPDVILHDIGFEGMSGIECVRKIKKISPQTEIIMVTVYDNSEHIFEALSAGATGYLLKSSSEEIIIRAIHDVIAGGSPMNASIARKAIEVFSKKHKVTNEYDLSSREKEILEHIVQGYGNKRIAESFNVSSHTIDAHLRNIYKKLHVHSRTEATSKAFKERLV